jgi:hypothetical protein
MSGITGNKYSCIIFVYTGRNTGSRNEYRHTGTQTDRQDRRTATYRNTDIHTYTYIQT